VGCHLPGRAKLAKQAQAVFAPRSTEALSDIMRYVVEREVRNIVVESCIQAAMGGGAIVRSS
jgi:hypothetical protein